MRIHFVTNYFPRSSDTSIGAWALSHVRALQKYHDVRVFVLTPWIPLCLSWIPGLKKLGGLRGVQLVDGTRVHYIQTPYYPIRKLRSVEALLVAIAKHLGPVALRRAFREIGSGDGLVLSHHTVPCGLLLHLAPGVKDHQVIHWNHDDGIINRADINPSLHELVGRCFAGSLANVWVSAQLTEHARTTWPELHFRTLLNGADSLESDKQLQSLRDSRRECAPSDNFKFICVAMFYPRKDHARLIRAFSQVVKCHPNASLVLCGSGPLEQNCRALARESKLCDRIHFKGRLSHRDALVEIANADCLVLAGWNEPWGIAITEGMALGLPIIYSNDGGIAPAIDELAVGCAIPPHDVDTLAEAMNSMISHPKTARELGENGKALVATKLSWDRRIREMEDIVSSHQQ